jgi:thiol-disulfide isomerase/thioredoxin
MPLAGCLEKLAVTRIDAMEEGKHTPPTGSRRAQLAWTVLVLLLAAGAAWTWLNRVPEGLPGLVRTTAPRNGFLAPAFNLSALDGQAYELATLRGKIVLVNFWATWCAPCREEMPALDKVYRSQKDNGIVILAVNQREDAPAVQAYATPLKLSLPLLLDLNGSASDLYQVRALPTTYFVDRHGVIRDIAYGALTTPQVIEDRLQPLLAAN